MYKMIKLFCLLLLIVGGAMGYVYTQKKDIIEIITEEEKLAKPLVSQDQPLPNVTIDRLLVLKSKRQMWAYQGEKLIKIYPIALGFNPIGHKQFEGDGKTPEGIYRINERNPNSAYHKNLGVSYPNKVDKEYAESQGKSPGGLIKIHGLRNGSGSIGRLHLLKDWTHGCIAVTNEEIDELYQSVKHNAEIDIRP